MTHIEFRPENGIAPWVIISYDKVKLWFAHPTRDAAAKKLPDIIELARKIRCLES